MLRGPVPQRVRNLIVKAGFAFEPPEHVRPKKGPCPYVDTKDPKTGEEVDRSFTYRGQSMRIEYVSGCFFPFIFENHG